MLKWKNFAKKISQYFSGNKTPKEAVPTLMQGRKFSFAVRARIFLLNNFFSSNSESREKQKNIYAEEGDLAYQKSLALNENLQGPLSGLYQAYKAARRDELNANLIPLNKIAEVKLVSLINVILKSYPLNPKCKFRKESLRQELQSYLKARADFELHPENQGTAYTKPFVSPNTTYAVMTTGSATSSKPVEMPRFRNTIGFSILNPFYWGAIVLNSVSKFCFEYPAHLICSGINKLFGLKKNSVAANGLKTLFAGPFLLLRAASFTVAKLLSPGGCKETWDVVRRKQQTKVADVSQLEFVPQRIIVSPPPHAKHLRTRSYPDSHMIFSVNSKNNDPNSSASIHISLEGKKHSPHHGVLSNTPSVFSRGTDNPEIEEHKMSGRSRWYDSQANVDIYKDVLAQSTPHSANLHSPHPHQRHPSSSVFFNSLNHSPASKAVEAKSEPNQMNSVMIHVKPRRPLACGAVLR